MPKQQSDAATKRRRMLALACLGLAALIGCRKQEPTPETQAADDAQAAVDQLRSVPYAGYADVPEGMEESGVVTHISEKVQPGYALYVTYELSRAELMDLDGNVVHTWKAAKGSKLWERGLLLPDGDLLVVGEDESEATPWTTTADARYVARYAWDGTQRWKRPNLAHHDLLPMPDGNFLTITFSIRSIPELHRELPVRDDCLTVLSPAGEELESVSLYDVLTADPGAFKLEPVQPAKVGRLLVVDLLHTNSLCWMDHPDLAGKHAIYGPDNLLISMRHQDSIAVIDWKQKKLVWSWGRGVVSGQHDAKLLDNGHILLFDNGLGSMRSRVIELDPIADKIVWEYRPDDEAFFTDFMGACQRLANGNTLITESKKGRAIEVTPAGEIVWEFRCPHTNPQGQRATILRMFRVPNEQVADLLNDETPGADPQ